MKVSADRNDPAFSDCFAMCRIWLEGAERSNVVTADEDGRFAVTTRLDENGDPVLRAGQPVTDVFRGAVRVECPDWLRKERETGIREHGPGIGT
ncbi:MAG: hypothetical protein HYX47_06340 [Burkholderiales bacterium]|nr:hypothetical protein [Burkholderiales bacterium]